MKSRFALAVFSFTLFSACVMGPAISKSHDGNLELNILADSDVRTARVFVDDVFVGHLSPTKPVLHLRRGPRAVRVELSGFKPWQQTVHILGDPNHQVLNAVLEKP